MRLRSSTKRSSETEVIASPADAGTGAILVATYGSPQCGEALAWAAAEAGARGCTLRIVHVVGWPPITADPFGGPPVDRVAEAAAAGAAILDEAITRAREIAPSVRLIRQLELDRLPSAGILRAARHDALIVLGRRGRHRRIRRFAHSTAAQVARQASCPVAVIGLLGESNEPTLARVAAVVDSRMASLNALDFAIDAAECRGVDVMVLRVRESGSEQFEVAFQERVRPQSHAGAPRVQVLDRAIANAPRLIAAAAGSAMVVLSADTPRSVRRTLYRRPGSSHCSAWGPVVFVGKGSP